MYQVNLTISLYMQLGNHPVFSLQILPIDINRLLVMEGTSLLQLEAIFDKTIAHLLNQLLRSLVHKSCIIKELSQLTTISTATRIRKSKSLWRLSTSTIKSLLANRQLQLHDTKFFICHLGHKVGYFPQKLIHQISLRLQIEHHSILSEIERNAIKCIRR